MALINCSECGHQVSDKATTCPNCGCPINTNEASANVDRSQEVEKFLLVLYYKT